MNRTPKLALGTLLLAAFLTAPSFGSELADKGREVFNKNEAAVVTVQVVVKATSSRGSAEFPHEITGTVIDPSGLTVLALSACDPYEFQRRLTPDYKVDSEVTSVKILLDDGTEVPCDLVLRDRDLDLAFIRPKSKLDKPMTAVNLANSGTAQILDEVVAINRLNKAASRAHSASIEHICAVIQKPRTFYIPDSTMTATTSGSPAFLLDGKVLGLFVMRAIPSATASNARDNLTSIILPAEDILKAAKQAPEVKADSEKKEEAKPESSEAN